MRLLNFAALAALSLPLPGALAAPAAAAPVVSAIAAALSPLTNPPPPSSPISTATAPTSFWQEKITRRGAAAFGPAGHKVFRNVRDYGATGDGRTDDTAAINRAIADGPERCGGGKIKCDSRTTTPAIIYFPPGTYRVSRPLNQYYYTQMIGNAVDPPVLKALPNFEGMAVIDADPYLPDGSNWFTNQNNFFRQVRNFVVDITEMPPDRGCGIHWQVAQATSLQNVRFEMSRSKKNNRQLGLFIDNGSGGYMSDLEFNGGQYGAFVGSQQFTARNLDFADCDTAIYMNWNWGWTFHAVTVKGCRVGIDMANGGFNQTVGSVVLLDSKIDAQVGFNTSFNANSVPLTGGSLVIENTDFGGPVAVQHADGATVLPGGYVGSFVQGRTYVGADGRRGRLSGPAIPKPAGLLDGNGHVFTRSKPTYADLDVSKFVSLKAAGAKGDGKTDDTAALQAALNRLKPDEVLFIDHGAYILTNTVTVPSKARIVGEFWPLLMAAGTNFADPSKLRPMLKVGEAGKSGAVEISDVMLETKGPAPGAILMQWNLNGKQGANGLWDVHARVGGSAGTELQSDRCAKKPLEENRVDPSCVGAGLLFHTTKSASVYTENCWFWVSDHELDRADYNQVDIFNARGVLVESQNPVWLVGTASEHNVMYNYQVVNAKNVWMGLIQSETPYFQGNPAAPKPFSRVFEHDPIFPETTFRYDSAGRRLRSRASTPVKSPTKAQAKTVAKGKTDPNVAGQLKSWGLRIVNSSDIYVYGAGLYSFFENYDQTCVGENDCQANMVEVKEPGKGVYLFGLSTKAAVEMVRFEAGESKGAVFDKDNRNNFCGNVARWTLQ